MNLIIWQKKWQSCFLVRKLSKSFNDQNGAMIAETEWIAASGLELDTALHDPASHSRQDCLCYCLSFHGIWRDTLQSLSAFLTKVIMKQHLLVQHSCLCLCHRTKAVLPRRPSDFKKVVLNEAVVGQCQRVERTKPFRGLLSTGILLMLQTTFQSDLQLVKRLHLPFHSLL